MNKGKIIFVTILCVVLMVAAGAFFVVWNSGHNAKTSESVITKTSTPSSIENPSYDDFVVLSQKGGKVTCMSIFYTDMWEEKSTTPYSLRLNYTNEHGSYEIGINNKKTLKEVYESLYSILLENGRIK